MRGSWVAASRVLRRELGVEVTGRNHCPPQLQRETWQQMLQLAWSPLCCAPARQAGWGAATKKMPHFLSLKKLIHYQKCSVNDAAGERDWEILVKTCFPPALKKRIKKNIIGARDLTTGNQSKQNYSILDTKQARQRTRTFPVVCLYH